MGAKRWSCAVSLFAGLGCATHEGDATGTTESAMVMPVPLTDPAAWVRPPVAEDLFAAMRPPGTECDDLRGYYIDQAAEAPRFEVNTGWCDYLTVRQPILESLDEGDVLEIRIYKLELTGGPGEGYVGVALGSDVIWEITVPIPSDGDLLETDLPITTPIPSGTPLQIHIHNHGINTWEFYAIDKIPSEP